MSSTGTKRALNQVLRLAEPLRVQWSLGVCVKFPTESADNDHGRRGISTSRRVSCISHVARRSWRAVLGIGNHRAQACGDAGDGGSGRPMCQVLTRYLAPTAPHGSGAGASSVTDLLPGPTDVSEPTDELLDCWRDDLRAVRGLPPSVAAEWRLKSSFCQFLLSAQRRLDRQTDRQTEP